MRKKVTIDSLKGSIPYMVMQCPELPQYKGDKKKGMSCYFRNPAHPEKNFTATNCQFNVQGTSSAGYPVKNYKISFKDASGQNYNWRGAGSRSTGHASGHYMYFIIIIYITCIRMENKE